MRFNKLLLILVLIFCLNIPSVAQYKFSVQNSFTFPNRMSYGEWKNSLSLTLAKLPKDAIEETSDIIYAPLFAYKTKIGLGNGFYSDGSFSTNGITFHFFTGINWCWHFGRINLGFGGGPAYFAGKLNAFGFDSKIKGLLGHNHYSLGIAFDKYTLTFKLEQTTKFLITQFADNLDVTEEQNIIGGFAFSVAIEQPLWKDNFLAMEVKANITRFYYPTWLVFSSYERYNLIPEVIIGLTL